MQVFVFQSLIIHQSEIPFVLLTVHVDALFPLEIFLFLDSLFQILINFHISLIN